MNHKRQCSGRSRLASTAVDLTDNSEGQSTDMLRAYAKCVTDLFVHWEHSQLVALQLIASGTVHVKEPTCPRWLIAIHHAYQICLHSLEIAVRFVQALLIAKNEPVTLLSASSTCFSNGDFTGSPRCS